MIPRIATLLSEQIDRVSTILADQGINRLDICLEPAVQRDLMTLSWPNTNFVIADYFDESLATAPCGSTELVLAIWDLVKTTRLRHVTIDPKVWVLTVEYEG